MTNRTAADLAAARRLSAEDVNAALGMTGRAGRLAVLVAQGEAFGEPRIPEAAALRRLLDLREEADAAGFEGFEVAVVG